MCHFPNNKKEMKILKEFSKYHAKWTKRLQIYENKFVTEMEKQEVLTQARAQMAGRFSIECRKTKTKPITYQLHFSVTQLKTANILLMIRISLYS